jgi:DNA-binding transcriptional ArsR family regulator
MLVSLLRQMAPQGDDKPRTTVPLRRLPARKEPSRLGILADPTLLAIFERLAEGPLAVMDLASAFPISRPAVSQHLRALKNAGLVIDRRFGNRRVYRLDPVGVAALRAYVDRFCDRALEAVKSDAEVLEGGFS